MPPRKKSSKQPDPGSDSFPEKLRSKLTEYLILALPIALVNGVVMWVMGRVFSQPWQILWIAVPLLIVAWLAWRRAVGRPDAKLGKAFLLLLSVYVLAFSLIAGAEFLNWKRTLQGYEQVVPRNFLALNWAGDWRYRFAGQVPTGTDFAIITTPPGESLEGGRVRLAGLIDFAVKQGVKGIAFDFHFRDDSDPDVDQKLCKAISDAEAAGKPVFVGHGFEYGSSGEVVWKGVAPNFKDCMPESRQGHTVAYAELDRSIRMVPLYFKNEATRESLSLKITRELGRQLGKNVQLPADGLVQFVKPSNDIPEIKRQDVSNHGPRLKDKFLLVGERGGKDTVGTPYGDVPGVFVHGFVVHSLRQNHFFRRVPWWSSFIMVFASCYLVTFFFAQKWTLLKKVLMTSLLSVAIFLISLVAVKFWLVWLDVIYPLIAMWLLFLLLLVIRRALGDARSAAA